MSKPIPGGNYLVEKDGSLSEIATQAYGDPIRASELWSANKSRTDEYVFKGETLIIPGDPPADKLTGKDPNFITILIDGLEVPMFSARILRTMDTGADGWSGAMVWNPGENSALDKATRPYSYARAAAYIGNELQVSGALYTVEPEKTESGIIKGLTGYSFTADAIDSHIQPPYQRVNITLEQLANELAATLGIKAVFEDDFGGPFARVTGHETDTIFTHLSKLASERGGLVGNTPQGDFLFQRAKTDGTPVGTLDESQPIVIEWKASYKGRKRFNAYKCIFAGVKTASPKWGQAAVGTPGPITITSPDPLVPRSRFQTFRADDTTQGDMIDAANWRKNKQLVESLTQSLKVVGWYAPNGSLWAPNRLVTVVSPTLGVPKGFTFLIKSVEFILEKERTAVLSLVPPQGYTKGEIGDVWALD